MDKSPCKVFTLLNIGHYSCFLKFNTDIQKVIVKNKWCIRTSSNTTASCLQLTRETYRKPPYVSQVPSSFTNLKRRNQEYDKGEDGDEETRLSKRTRSHPGRPRTGVVRDLRSTTPFHQRKDIVVTTVKAKLPQ